MLTSAKWSIQNYHQMITAGILCDRKVELLAGEIVEMSPEGPVHASRLRKVAHYIRERLGDVALVSEAHPITLSHSEPEPDLAIVRLPLSRYDTHHPYPQDIFWLIEISETTLAKDRQVKKQIYASAQIPEYWVIDLNSNCLMVFRQPQNQDYLYQETITQGTLSPLAFPDCAIAVESLLS